MAFGIQTESSGGNFTATVKVNAKQGRVWRVDRTQNGDGQWATDEVDITSIFQFVPDLPNIEIGWMHFAAGQAPDLRMVKIGEVMPDRPSENHKQGVRLLVKLGAACGGDLREIAATAKSILGPLDRLHDEYLKGVKDHAGELPVVKMTSMKKVDTKTAHGTNTNFEPVFEIVKWVEAPSFAPEAAKPAAAPAAAVETKPEPATAGADF